MYCNSLYVNECAFLPRIRICTTANQNSCRAFPPVYMNHGPINNILSKATEQMHVV